MVWFMDINLTDNRTTVGSYDNRSSGGVLLMPKERHMREGAPIQPHAHALQCAKPAGRFAHCTHMMATLTPHELVDGFAPMVIRHHGDSLWDKAADDFYFLKETRVPRVAWRFVYEDAVNYPEDGDEDLSEMEQYI